MDVDCISEWIPFQKPWLRDSREQQFQGVCGDEPWASGTCQLRHRNKEVLKIQ